LSLIGRLSFLNKIKLFIPKGFEASMQLAVGFQKVIELLFQKKNNVAWRIVLGFLRFLLFYSARSYDSYNE
jgi:hypothetical protein